jgi:hypothetical protein
VTSQEQTVLGRIRDIYNQLSPENLTCDGELSPKAVRRRYQLLKRELQTLFKVLGREVSEDEAFQNYQLTKGA